MKIAKQPKFVALKTYNFFTGLFQCMSLCGLRIILQQPYLGLLFNIHISKFKLTSVDCIMDKQHSSGFHAHQSVRAVILEYAYSP